MRAGDIVFVRGASLLSNIIKHFDKGEFSHVAIAVSNTHIFEAQYYTRAEIVPMHYVDYETVPLDLTDKEIEKLQVICRILTGKWYDYRQAFGYVLRALLNYDINRFNNPNNLICSEALGLILYVLDKIDSTLSTVTPNELYQLLQSRKETLHVTNAGRC